MWQKEYYLVNNNCQKNNDIINEALMCINLHAFTISKKCADHAEVIYHAEVYMLNRSITYQTI